MKRKIMIIGIVIVLIIESVFIYNLFKSNKSQILQDIKTVDVFDNKNKTLSIMIQQDETLEYKEDTSRTTWPSRDEYMYAGSKCVGEDGTDLGDSTKYINFEETSPNPTVTIKTKKTIYCTLYFGKARPVMEVLRAKGKETFAGGGEQNTVVDGMYRFYGTASQVTNNYICLGDENPDVCKTNPDNLYRIIGVTTDGKLKVIKASKSSKQKWGSSDFDGVSWSGSITYRYLNGTSSEQFYGLLDGKIKELIEKHTWNMEYYNDETSWPSSNPTSDSIKNGTVSNYIGLMYATDYQNAGPVGKTNWLYIQNGMSGNEEESEWTMSYFGYNSRQWNPYSYTAWVCSSGRISNTPVKGEFAVRPVFYLIPGIGLSGEGIEERPFTITKMLTS